MTTVVLGLDGGCFELIQPWIDDGDLPNFATLIQDGIAEDMQSCLPPVTCPNWQCYATGTNPGKLGVFWWEAVDEVERTIENRSAAGDFDGAHYWHLLDGEVAVVNLPTSYPPTEVDGIHIAGGPGAEQSGYTHPASLEADLEERYGYAVHPEKMSLLSGDDPENDCIGEIYELIDSRFDVLEDELASGKYELIHVTVFYLNVLQHFYWDMDVVKSAWKKIDERVGRLLSMPEMETLVVMSDHGSNEIQTTFRINTWLQEHGYLQTERSISDYLHRAGVTQERIRPILAKLGLEWWARKLLPDRVQMYLPSGDGAVDKSGKENVLDWERSTAIASGQGPVYVLADDADEREQLISTLQTELEGLTGDEGNPVFDAVLRGDHVYSGPYVEQRPDLVLDQAAGVHIEGKIGHDEVFGTPSKWHGENKDTGMFIGYGPDVDDDGEVPNMHILDIAPTLLHLHGQNVPERMDGEVRKELFTTDSEPANREVTRTAIDEETVSGDESGRRDVTARLEDLGYME